MESRRPRWPWPRLLPLCALTALLYAGAVPSGFVLDDQLAVVSSPVVTGEVSPLEMVTTEGGWPGWLAHDAATEKGARMRRWTTP